MADLAPAIRDGAIDAIRRSINRSTELREALARKVSVDTGQSWRAKEIAVVVAALLTEAGVASILRHSLGDLTGLRISYGVLPEKLGTGLNRLVEVLNRFE